MKLYEVTVKVSYEQIISVYAKDEDEACEWAEKEARDDAPNGMYIETEIYDIQIDNDSYQDEDR